MDGNRIREIRRQKRITLHDLAARIKPKPTTAQTIGRLETGARTLSLKWLNKIAEVLECDPSDLLSAPAAPKLPVAGHLKADGGILLVSGETAALQASATIPMCLRIDITADDYRAGDILLLDRFEGRDIELKAEGHDCLVEDSAGDLHFGKIIRGGKADRFTLLPIPAGEIKYDIRLKWAARAISLIRNL